MGILVLAGLLLMAWNLWETAARSTIPLDLNAVVLLLEVRHEKHPGFDDTLFLILDDGRELHVDWRVFDGVEAGDLLIKRRFESELKVVHPDGQSSQLPLTPSIDFRGMRRIAPIMIGAIGLLAYLAGRGLSRSVQRPIAMPGV